MSTLGKANYLKRRRSSCCNLERIMENLRIYVYIYIEHAASALYNESKQKGTSVHKEPK